jgi:hypothetical protein
VVECLPSKYKDPGFHPHHTHTQVKAKD